MNSKHEGVNWIVADFRRDLARLIQFHGKLNKLLNKCDKKVLNSIYANVNEHKLLQQTRNEIELITEKILECTTLIKNITWEHGVFSEDEEEYVV